ncbi:MAG: hypothetical protein AAB903_01935 [Patescibacteria group bacterium]
MNKKTIAVSLLATLILVGAQATYAKDDKEKKNNQPNKIQKSLVLPIPSGTSMEIGQNGRVSVSGARVSSVSGSVITATTTWEGFTLSWIINTDGNTNFNARYGGNQNISNISVGDHVSFKGAITGAGPTVLASVVTDLLTQRRNATFLGEVTSVNSSTMSFVMNTRERGTQTVLVSSSTKFLGTLNNFSFVTVGAKAQTSGLWNTEQNTLQAAHILVMKDKRNEERVFEGKVKSVSASTTPATIVATIDGTDRTITLATDTSILNYYWQRVTLGAFKVGDMIRVYGIGQDFSIGATVVRNVSLK